MAFSVRDMRTLAALLAVITWAALLLQLYLSFGMVRANGGSAWNALVIYFGFFTVLTNALVALALTFPLLAPTSFGGRFFSRPGVIAGVAVSIALVAIVYHVMLRGLMHLSGLGWLTNALMHYVVPIVFVGYAWTMLRGVRLRWVLPLFWSLYLAAYFVYVMVRGAMIGRYPYPFIDVTELGYAQTFRHALLMLVAFLLLSYAFVALTRLRNRWIGA